MNADALDDENIKNRIRKWKCCTPTVISLANCEDQLRLFDWRNLMWDVAPFPLRERLFLFQCKDNNFPYLLSIRCRMGKI